MTLDRWRVAAGVGLGAAVGGLVAVDPRLVVAMAVVAAGVVAWMVSSRRTGVAALAWAGCAFTTPFNGVRLSSTVALSDAFLVVAVVAMLPSMAMRHRWSLPRSDNGVLLGLALIAAGGLVGTLFAVGAVASLVEMAKFVFAGAGSIVAVRLWDPGPRQLRWFISLWLAGAVASSLWALTFSPSIVGRPLGLSTHPNHLGIVCLLAAGIALGFALGGAPRARLLGMVALPPLVVALVASGSRAALLGFFVMVPTVAVLTYRVQLAVRAGAVAAVFALAVVAGVVHLPADTGLGRLFGEGSTQGSNASRIDHLSRSIDRFERHPLTGEGFEFAQEAHNVYLQVLVAAGPLGLVGLVVVAGSVLTASRKGIRGRPDPMRGDRMRGDRTGGDRTGGDRMRGDRTGGDRMGGDRMRGDRTGGDRMGGDRMGGDRVTGERALLGGLGGGYVGYLVAGLFQNILWDRYLWLYIAAALALASSLQAGPEPGPPGADGSGRLLLEGEVVRAAGVAQGPFELPPPDGGADPGGDR